MIHTSKEYKEKIRKNRIFHRKATLILSDGTILNLVDEDFMSGGIRIDDSVGDKVMIGTATINKATITLNNFKGKFSTFDFTDAVIRPYIGLELGETTEYLPRGVFTTDSPIAKGSLIVLEALDNMAKFDTEFKEINLIFPCTNLQLLQAVCLHCNVPLASVQFLNKDFVVHERPGDENTSCREIVSWIAQIAGCFARCNNEGALEFKWFDFEVFEEEGGMDGGAFDQDTPYIFGEHANGGHFKDYNSGDSLDGGTFLTMNRYHHIYSFSSTPVVGTDDVVITGIQVSDNTETPTTVLFGSMGYVLPIEGNLLIQKASNVQKIANSVGAKIVGMKFRHFSCSAQSDPSMEAGDVGYLSERKGNSYPVIITSLSFAVGDAMTLSCGIETPAKRNYRPTQEMKAIVEARKVAKEQITAYDMAVKQLNDLVMHSFGVYRSEETLEDGSTIFYSHDKPTLAESQTIWKQTANTFTVSNDGGQTWRGMDADGNMVATVLNAIGVNAEWIKVLTSFTVGNNFSVDALGKLIASNADITGKITARNGKIGRLTISNDGLKSNAMELLDDDVNPLIWLKSADDSESANYEGALSYLRHSNNGKRQTLLIDTRPSWIHGMELTKENIQNNSDIQGETYDRVRYTADGITKTSDVPSSYSMNILGHSVFFGNDAIYITEKNGNFISLNQYGVQLISVDGGTISSTGNGLQLSHQGGVYANGRNITVAPLELSMLNDMVQDMNYDIQNIKRYLNI